MAFDFDKFFEEYRGGVEAAQTTTLRDIFLKHYGYDIKTDLKEYNKEYNKEFENGN